MSVTTKKKHVERELYEDFTLPEEHQAIVRVVRPRGNNLHQVTTADGEEFLVSMPHKFRKHVWIKRGDFVVTEPIPEGNKVRAEIVRILLKDHIRYLVQNNMWPEAFVDQLGDEKIVRSDREAVKRGKEIDSVDLLIENPNRQTVYYEESDTDSDEDDEDDRGGVKGGEESDSDSDSDDSLMENPNRPKVFYEESETDSDEDEDSDDEDDDDDSSLAKYTSGLNVTAQDPNGSDGEDSPKEND